jgi:hypothetical protein
MLRYYKHILKKNIPLNQFLRKLDFEIDKMNSYDWYIHYFYYYIKKDMTLKIISKNAFNQLKYQIVKELKTDTRFFVCPKLIIFYISEKDFQEFCFSFINSDLYSFMIFKTDIYYVAICTSHTSDMIDDLKHFLISNNTSLSYFILSNFLYHKKNKTTINDNDDISNKLDKQFTSQPSGFIILNTNYKSRDAKIKYELDFQIKLGNGNVIDDINQIIKIIQVHVKNNTYLPVNYLSIA